jgi:hypothetical protein
LVGDLSDAMLDQIFQSSVFSYSSTTDFLLSSASMMATTSHPDATVSVNGTNVLSAVPTDPISLVEGDNTITIVVTAEDGGHDRKTTID